MQIDAQNSRCTGWLNRSMPNHALNDDGTFLHQWMPGDPDFINPMNDGDQSFVGTTQDWINHLNYLQNRIDPPRYQRDIAFWQSFQESLVRNGAA